MKNKTIWVASVALAVSACGAGGNGNNNNNNNNNNNPDDCALLPAIDSPDVVVPAGCYRAEQNVVVGDGQQLTLDPGVVIFFAPDTVLDVRGGKLNAEGTMTQPIVLTAEQETRGQWTGVRISDSDFLENQLHFVSIEYAGGGTPAGALTLGTGSSPVRLTGDNLTIRQSAGYGLYLQPQGGGHVLTWTNNRILNNAQVAFVPANDVASLGTTSTWSGNGEDMIITGGALASDAIWAALDVPYRVQDDIVLNDTKLELSAGVTLQHEAGVGIDVEAQGALTSLGTAADPVVLTGAQMTRGFWRGVFFDSSNSVDNRFEYTVIEYGGADISGVPGAANVYLRDNAGAARVSFDNCTLRQSLDWGLYAEGEQNANEITLTNSIVTENARAIRIPAEDGGDLDANTTFVGNDEDYVALVGAVDTTQSWPGIDVPWRLEEEVRVEMEADLSIEAGSVVEFGPGSGFHVRGSLAADGTAAAMVTFTGKEKTAGYWRSIRYDSSGSTNNRMVYVLLEYGGSTAGDDNGLIHLDDDRLASRLLVDNTTFRESSNWGIYAEDEQNPPVVSCVNVTFEMASLARGAVGNSAGPTPAVCN